VYDLNAYNFFFRRISILIQKDLLGICALFANLEAKKRSSDRGRNPEKRIHQIPNSRKENNRLYSIMVQRRMKYNIFKRRKR
jgi:hypothetical protein